MDAGFKAGDDKLRYVPYVRGLVTSARVLESISRYPGQSIQALGFMLPACGVRHVVGFSIFVGILARRTKSFQKDRSKLMGVAVMRQFSWTILSTATEYSRINTSTTFLIHHIHFSVVN